MNAVFLTMVFLMADVSVLGHGCDKELKDKLEGKCDATYEVISNENEKIEDDAVRMEAQCCALESMEKCSLRAYDRADCAEDKPVLRENLKAARLFLSVMSEFTCAEFRGRCSAAPASYSWTLWTLLITLTFLVIL